LRNLFHHRHVRGAPHPRNIVLLDNDFLGLPHWKGRIAEIRDGCFCVCFTQGLDIRLMTDEQAEALASVAYHDSNFRTRRLYAARDNIRDEDRVFRGLRTLVRYGVRPDNIMVYVLVGHRDGENSRRPRILSGPFTPVRFAVDALCTTNAILN